MINVCKFYEVYCEVEPKRRALNEANQMLQDAQTRLSNLVAKVAKLEETLADLTRRYTVAVEAKVKCQQDADATGATISLANRLVGGLASEKVRQILRFPNQVCNVHCAGALGHLGQAAEGTGGHDAWRCSPRLLLHILRRLLHQAIQGEKFVILVLTLLAPVGSAGEEMDSTSCCDEGQEDPDVIG